MKKMIMLCPVGTSLAGNIKNNLSELLPAYQQVCGLINKEIDKHDMWDDWSSWGEWRNDLVDILNQYPQSIGEPTAELTSTINWLQQLPEPIDLEIYLFPSESEKSVANAFVTQYKLDNMFKSGSLHGVYSLIFRCNYVPVTVTDKKSFDKSIDILFKNYNKILDDNPKNDAVINATGGYKSISAYSVLYAQLRELPSIYNFEENRRTAFELLPLPISYALDALDEEMNMLRAIEKGEDKLKGFAKSHFRPWLRALVQQDEPEGMAREKRQAPKALITMFLDHHTRQKARGGAYGSALLEVLRAKELQRGNASPYYDYLAQRISNEWSELWMGDQIPETVEHSRQHSKRLMELASYLFRADCPKLHDLQLDDPFSLALLISAIFLHDIGHTAIVHPVKQERYPNNDTLPLGMFPSCVREVHHLLSADLINAKIDQLFPLAGCDADLTPTVSMLRLLIPLISEHHRGYTKLLHDKAKAKPIVEAVGKLLYGDYFEKTLEPLDARLRQLTEIPPELHDRILRTTALLRVLDGCDVQADRTVGDNYMRARLERTRDEAEGIWRQLQPFLKDITEIFDDIDPLKEALIIINYLSKRLTPDDAIAGTLDKKSKEDLDDLCKRVYAKVLEQLHIMHMVGGYDVRGRSDSDKLLFLSLCNRFAFKWEQFLHFHKHRCVSFIMPLVNDKGEPVFQIWPSEFVDASGRGTSPDRVDEQLNNVRKDIKDEIKETGGLLDALNIQVTTVPSSRQQAGSAHS